ncbi:MAG: ribonuclease R, partial [Verrucomicrobiales bacterium]
MEKKILTLLGKKDYVPLNPSDMMRRLKVAPEDEEAFHQTLKDLVRTGSIARIKANRYMKPKQDDLVTGRIRINRAGKGFLQPDDPSLKEIAIPANATSTALHNDRVVVRKEAKKPSRRDEEEGDQKGTGS